MLTKNHCEGTFQGANGIHLYYQSWYPQASGQAVLVIVHGSGAHSGIFTTMVETFIEHNYIIYSFDLRGCGQSPGQRGYINCWSEYREDLNAFLNLVKSKEPQKYLFVIGQSLGGTISLDYALREPNFLKGLIVLSPALEIGVSEWKLSMAKLISGILPNFSLSTGLGFSAVSRDPEVVAACKEDSLRHRLGSARLATELLKTIDWIKAHATEMKIPLLILHGGADIVTLPQSSRDFFESLNLADKERKEYPDGYHELHNDINSREVLGDIENWIQRHL
ncbi:MAG: alpha/beta hydrolase [Rivularia sp. ALOHA_DT_140]|nr:alpha/beta hydrolase [Rivularia sp. ALOHA_DT_140]